MPGIHNQLPPQEDFSGWYNDAIREGGLIAESPTKGVWTLLPRATGLWNAIRRDMTAGMEEIGIGEVTMPTLFPMSLLEREAEHVEGFAPEVFNVTRAGSKVLEDPLVVRPTSEVVASELLRDMITSYRDLPYNINQWSSAFRAEKRPRPFLRTTEFLWQEGYGAHKSDDEADAHAKRMADFYGDFIAQRLSIASIAGEKSDNERFPGAVATYALEGQLGGRALQLATSHHLGTGFAESHNVMYTNVDGDTVPVHQTSWGSSTRLIGAVVMAHGDEKGIILPPQISPEPVTIIPAWRSEADKSTIEGYAQNIKANLGSRVSIGKRDVGDRLGAVYYAVERTGSPLQLVVGQREIDAGAISYKFRHSGEQGSIKLDELAVAVPALLNRIAKELLDRSSEKQADAMIEVEGDVQALVDGTNQGKMVLAGWSGNANDEKRLKAETGITIRVHPDGYEDRRDPLTGKAGRAALFAKAY